MKPRSTRLTDDFHQNTNNQIDKRSTIKKHESTNMLPIRTRETNSIAKGNDRRGNLN